MNFIRSYTKSPTVVLTAKHSSSGGNAGAESNGIVSWIEVILKLLKGTISMGGEEEYGHTQGRIVSVMMSPQSLHKV